MYARLNEVHSWFDCVIILAGSSERGVGLSYGGASAVKRLRHVLLHSRLKFKTALSGNIGQIWSYGRLESSSHVRWECRVRLAVSARHILGSS